MGSELLCPAICFRDLPESCFPYKTGPTIETAQNLGNLNEINVWSRVSTIKHVYVCTSTGHPLPAELGCPRLGHPGSSGAPRLPVRTAALGPASPLPRPPQPCLAAAASAPLRPTGMGGARAAGAGWELGGLTRGRELPVQAPGPECRLVKL